MTLQELYDFLKGDCSDACRRLMNEKMVAHFVLMFPNDPTMQNLRNAVSAADIEKSFRAAHTLKGVAGNLGLTQLYNVAVELTEQLRPRLETADPKLFDAVEKEYQRTVKAIWEFGADKPGA